MSEQIVSRVYQPNPEKCCEACVFGTGAHAEWCSSLDMEARRKSLADECGEGIANAVYGFK